MASGFDEVDEQGTRCFRPGIPLPPPLEHVADLLDAATDAVRQFDRRLQDWDHPHDVVRLFARLDAVSSSGAEGSTTTFSDLLEFESSLGTAPDGADASSVAALLDATTDAIEGDLRDTILRLHRRLFERGVGRKAAEAGRFRTRVNRTVDSDSPGGLFAYTRPSSVEAAMADWTTFVLADDPQCPELVRQSLGHWVFEHVHPFADGNGRVGRLLIPIILRRKGFTRSVSAFVSEGVYFDKDLYVEALKDARVTNTMLGWTRLMLGFLAQGATANLQRLDRLLVIRREWEQAVAAVRADSVVHRLAPFALTRPAFTVSDALAGVGGSFASVNNAIGRLVALNILTVANGHRRDRLFQAPAVLDIFDHART